jgi:hypothetical protein
MRGHHQIRSSLAILGLLVALPACAEDGDVQIIGTPPTLGCCWGNLPDTGDKIAAVGGVPSVGLAIDAILLPRMKGQAG